jgi:hypothetical protein
MAAVYRVRHNDLHTEHALKVVTRLTGDATHRLLREGRTMGRLKHPGVVQVTDLIDVDGAPGLVMELVAGPTLKELLADGPLPPSERNNIVRQVLQAVGAAHSAGFVHRDLKPSNILTTAGHDGRRIAKVADFGLVKALVASDDTLKTADGMTLGTPAYMAPEQLSGEFDVNPATDIWALGAMLYEISTGDRAFPGRDMMLVLGAISMAKFDRDRLASLTPAQRRAIESSLAIDPAKRPRSCRQLLDLWFDTSEPQSTTATIELQTTVVDDKPVRRSRPLWLGAGLLAGAIALIAWFSQPGGENGPHADRLRTAEQALHDTDFDAAIQHAQRVLAKSEGHPFATLLLTDALYFDGQEAAAHDTIESFQARPGSNDVYTDLLLIKQRALSGQDVQAHATAHFAQYGDDATRELSASWLFDTKLGLPTLIQDRVVALERTEKAQELRPDSALAHFATFSYGEEDVAHHLETALTLQPHSRSLNWTAVVRHFELGELDAATARVQQLTTEHPKHSVTTTARLMLALHQGDKPKRDQLQSALRVLPPDARASALNLVIPAACGLGHVQWVFQEAQATLDSFPRPEPEAADVALQTTMCAAGHLDFEAVRIWTAHMAELAVAPELSAATQQDMQNSALRFGSFALSQEGPLAEAELASTRLEDLGEDIRINLPGLAVLSNDRSAPIEASGEACLRHWVAGLANESLGFTSEARESFEKLTSMCGVHDMERAWKAEGHARLAKLDAADGDAPSAIAHAEAAIALLEHGDADLSPLVIAREVLQVTPR